MSDEQINAAIAEACWCGDEPVLNTDENRVWVTSHPNYCTDLNAMAEAEKALSSAKEKMYFANLKKIVGDLTWHRTIGKLYRATARQRAEAFLLTLGKWEEVQE